MSASNYTPYATFKRWHDAGASLLTAFDHYVDTCAGIQSGLATQEKGTEDFVSKIEITLETVHAVISSRLPKITTALVQTRNKLISPVFRFPEEVLSKVFSNFVFDPSLDASNPLSMDQSVRLVYARLYTICSVCSTWRDIVMARGTLWSIIPLIPIPLANNLKTHELSLQRARGSLLHLAADITYKSDMQKVLLKVLSEYGSRFEAVNLRLDERGLETVTSVIDTLLYHNTTGTWPLSELSIKLHNTHPRRIGRRIYHDDDDDDDDDDSNVHYTLPRDYEHIFPRDSPQQTSFIQLLGSLTIFRVSGLLCYWDSVAFSSRLVKLQIEKVTLGYDDKIVSFLNSLSSASELRDLTISEVISFDKTDTTDGVNTHPVIVLPKLQSLLLQDLYFNTLRIILSAIGSSPQHLTLSLSDKCLSVYQIRTNFYQSTWGGELDADVAVDDSGPKPVDHGELLAVLGSVRVKAVRLGRSLQPAVPQSLFCAIMETMPTIQTLEIDRWYFDDEPLDDIPSASSQSYVDQPDSEGRSFPVLENLHLTRITIYNRQVFQKMVSSRSVRQIVVGGSIMTIDSSGDRSSHPLQESVDLLQWLQENIPHVRLVDSKYCPLEFHRPVWKLW